MGDMSGDYGLSPLAEAADKVYQQHRREIRAEMAAEIFQWLLEFRAVIPDDTVSEIIKRLRYR